VSVSADEVSAHGDKDHRLRDVDTLLVVAHEPAPSGHPSEGALDDPAAWQDLEAVLAVGSADDLDDELEVGGLVHKFEPVVGAVGEQVLHPGPPLANVVQDLLGASAVRKNASSSWRSGPSGHRSALSTSRA
jgi:hypothetical protein